jgi:hypothetical protein
LFSHNTKFLIETSASASHKNLLLLLSKCFPPTTESSSFCSYQAREREKERERKRERERGPSSLQTFEENQNFTEKIPSPLFLQATNY